MGAITSSSAMAQNPLALLEQQHTLHKFCFIKKEIPPNFSLAYEPYELNLAANLKSNFILSKSFSPLPFPKSLQPNQLPVAVFVNGKRYFLTSSGFSENAPFTNPLSIGYGDKFSFTKGGDVTLTENKDELTEKDFQNGIVIPFKYFLGDQIIENKMKIYLKKIEGVLVEGNSIDKIEFNKPLPPGLVIKSDSPFVLPSRIALFQKLDFIYEGKAQLVFVKSFDLPVVDQKNLLNGSFPLIVAENGKCSSLEFRNRVLIPKATNQARYDNYFKNEDAAVNELGLDNVKLKPLLEQLKSLNLYEVYSLEKVFPGNGRVDKKCSLEFFEIESLFNSVKKNKIDLIGEYGDVVAINVPPEETSSIDLQVGTSKKTIKIVKQFFLNPNWKPVKDRLKVDPECGRWCPKIFAKEKIDYFKNIKVTLPSSAFKEDELTCGMTGTNNHSYEATDFDFLDNF